MAPRAVSRWASRTRLRAPSRVPVSRAHRVSRPRASPVSRVTAAPEAAVPAGRRQAVALQLLVLHPRARERARRAGPAPARGRPPEVPAGEKFQLRAGVATVRITRRPATAPVAARITRPRVTGAAAVRIVRLPATEMVAVRIVHPRPPAADHRPIRATEDRA